MTRARTIAIGLALAAAGCGGVQSPLNPAGPQASAIAALTWRFFILCGVIYVLVIAALLWAIARTPKARDETPEGERRLGRVIAGLAALTTAILVVLAVSSVIAGRGLTSPSGPGAITIDAIGHQWWWEFEYQDVSAAERVNSPNELHIPVGVPVVIKAMSRDVIHSLWVPNLIGKRDLIPGIVTHTWIQADKPGVYRGQCAEFCGPQHAHMALLVVAEPRDRFEAWLQHQRTAAPQPSTPEQQRGRDLFMSGPCVMCHTIRGTSAASNVGPDLTHVYGRQTIAAGSLPTTRGHLAGWISDSQAIKPGNRMPPVPLNGEDLQALLAYLETLR
jgi:cytochrome c oxidase subunit 2